MSTARGAAVLERLLALPLASQLPLRVGVSVPVCGLSVAHLKRTMQREVSRCGLNLELCNWGAHIIKAVHHLRASGGST